MKNHLSSHPNSGMQDSRLRRPLDLRLHHLMHESTQEEAGERLYNLSRCLTARYLPEVNLEIERKIHEASLRPTDSKVSADSEVWDATH